MDTRTPDNTPHYYYSGKYTLPAAAVVVITLLLGAVLGASYFYSYKLNRLAVQLEAAGRLHDDIISLTPLARKQIEQHNNRPVSVPDIKNITDTAAEAEKLLADLEPSGSLALPAAAQGDIAHIRSVWDKFRSKIPAAGSPAQQTVDAMNALNSYAYDANPVVSQRFQNLNAALLQHSRNAAAIAQYAQLAGLALLLLGLAAFGYRTWRQAQHDRVLEMQHIETHEILDTLSEGLFLLDKDMKIGSQQSQTLKQLLPQSGEGGQDFLELVADILPDRKKLSAVKMFIEQLYNPRVVEKLTYNLNPLRKVEVQIKGKGGTPAVKILGFHFTRVIKDKKIIKILVSVRDMTDTVRMEARLEREQEQNDLQIEMISRMLNADESIMRGFLNTSLTQLAQINTILKNPGSNLSDLSQKLRLISQEIHAFKGEASVLNMSAFVLAAESFEDIIQQMKNNQRALAGKDFLPLVVELESLLEKVAQAEELHRKMTGRLNNPAPLPVAATATDLGTLFGRFVVNMGYRHNKSVIMETGGLEHLQQHAPSFPAVKDIIIQLLRNSVVHGIEPVRVRTLNGKPGEGRIRLNVSQVENKIRILVEDDGRGIDFNAVRAKAVEEQLVTAEQAPDLSESQLYALLFRPGFSTLPESNEDAGRGIGMDVVRTRIKALNGRIALHTETGLYTRVVITLPHEHE